MAKVEIAVIQGELKGLLLVFLRPQCVLFGRAADATIRITDDPFVSRHHFLLEVSPPFVLLSDLGSKNGVFVNDTRYGSREPGAGNERNGPVPPKSVFLANGDRVVVGQNRLVVNIMETENRALPVRRKTSAKWNLPFTGVPSTAMGELSSETLIGPYHLGQEIGRGWMGAVYQAIDTRSGVLVAVKTMVPNVVFSDEAAESFLANARRFLGFEHPSVCGLIDIRRTGNIFTSVQEFVDGFDLFRFLALRGGKLNLEEAIPIMLDVLAGLSAEDQKFHRNLKPQNILVSGQGKWIRAKISDFGLYRAMEISGLTQMILSGLYADSVCYWPRERITFFEQAFAPSEVFSAAAVFYEMLTGFLPREGLRELKNESRRTGSIPGLAEFLRVIAERKPTPILERNPEIPKRVAEVIDKALSEPIIRRGQEIPELILSTARYRDAETFREALLEAVEFHGIAPKKTEADFSEGFEAPGEKIDAALLVVDLEGSTQLVNKNGTHFFTEIVNSFHSLFQNHESRKELRFLKCTGDGFFAIYRQANEALQAARAVIAEAKRNDVQVRVAMNFGKITIASDGDFLGREVHKLFRIEGLKNSDRVSDTPVSFPTHGRILVTRSFAEKAAGKFLDIGLFRLKGFEEPCEVLLFCEQ